MSGAAGGDRVDDSAPRHPPDLRLAGLAAGTWLSALAALRASLTIVVWAVAMSAVAAAAVAVQPRLNRRRGGRPQPVRVGRGRPGPVRVGRGRSGPVWRRRGRSGPAQPRPVRSGLGRWRSGWSCLRSGWSGFGRRWSGWSRRRSGWLGLSRWRSGWSRWRSRRSGPGRWRSRRSGLGRSGSRRSGPGRWRCIWSGLGRSRPGWLRLSSAWLAGWRWIAVGGLLGVLCGASATGARLAARDAGPIAELARAGTQVTTDLTVREDPRRLAGVTGRPPAYLVPAKLNGIRADGLGTVRLSVRVVVLTNNSSWSALLPGQHVEARARLREPRRGGLTAAVLSASGAPRLIGKPPWPQRAAGALRSGLQRACAPLPDPPGGLLPGLVVGDVSHLDPAVADSFRATGMTHLTAVSGWNVR